MEVPRTERLNSTGQSGSNHSLTRHVRARLDDNILLTERSSSDNRAIDIGEDSTDDVDMDGLFRDDSVNDDAVGDKDTSEQLP